MHALHAYSGMQHYSTTGRVLACTSSSYPPSTYSYGALLVMQRIMSFCLLVHTLHSTRGMTDYAPIHERKEARRCGTPGVCIHHEYQHISKDVMQDILEYMHIHVLQETAASVEHIRRMVHENDGRICACIPGNALLPE